MGVSSQLGELAELGEIHLEIRGEAMDGGSKVSVDGCELLDAGI
jgi:hypothetical protein